jgi:beta-mannosidase
MTYTDLTDGWTLTAVDGPVPTELAGTQVPATVPGCVHTGLVSANLIADPFDGDNEAALQWIGRTAWRYQTVFSWQDDGSARHDLVAQGLDTFATIELNGEVVGRTQNQHRSYRFDIRSLLVSGENTLAVTFDAPVTEAERRSTEHGPLPHVNHHPFNSVRKMAANFGWDWGIDVATSGIWKPIGIDSWSVARMSAVRPLVDVNGTEGILTAHIDLERADTTSDLELTVTVGDVESRVSVAAGESSAVVTATVPGAELWWPIGHGEQPLYDASLTLASGGEPLDDWAGRVGFRTVQLDTAPDEAGSPFILSVNGEAMQIRGANWIPDHAFVTEIDRDRFARRIEDAVDANMNLLRVWGGGLYESDDFYELCDEAGILVWQDFLFACAAYAEEDWLATEVEAEAREQIARLSAHPSLVIWNGNNENIWGFVAWGWRQPLAGRTWGEGYYRRLLPGLLAELDPSRSYSPASPYSFSEYLHPNDPLNGTMHIWDVWNERDYTYYRNYSPRFVSEFGFQGPPAWSTLTSVVHDDPLDAYGEQMLVHQKAADGNLKLEKGMKGHLPAPASIEDWHWATQLNQAHALRFGIEHFRSLTPHCMGMIVWQLNDNWPVVSWAAVDFAEQRKPLWYAIRDAYRPRLATIQPRDGGLSLVLVNDTPNDWTGSLSARRITVDGVELAHQRLEATVSARGALTIALAADVALPAEPSTELIVVQPIDGGSAGFGRALWNFTEVVDQGLDPDALDAKVHRLPDGYAVTVTARSYLRDVTMQADRADANSRVDSGLVTLLPGESATFYVRSDAELAESDLLDPLVLRSANALLT